MPDSIPCETFPQSNAKKEILQAQNLNDVVHASVKRLASPDPDGSSISKMGQVVYQSIQANQHLSERQKHEATCMVGQQAIAHSANAARSNPSTFLRETTAHVKFINLAMEDKADRYIQSVTQKALQTGAQHAGGNTKDATKDLMKAISEEKHQLSDDACDFLQSCADGVPDDLQNGQLTLMRTTLVLNTTSPAIVNAIVGKTDPASMMLSEANRARLQYVNSFGGNAEGLTYDAAIQLSGDENDDNELKEQFQETIQQLATGDKDALRAGAPPLPTVAQVLDNKIHDAQAKLDARQQKLNDYLGRLDTSNQSKNLKQSSLDNAADNPHVPDDLRQKEAAAIQKIDRKIVRLESKVQHQQEKVERSETRVDQLQSRRAKL